jgi:hypothetical protein
MRNQQNEKTDLQTKTDLENGAILPDLVQASTSGLLVNVSDGLRQSDFLDVWNTLRNVA